MRAVIMAGGKGTRLASVAVDIPKPMIPILRKPILLYQIESLKRSGIKDIIIVVGHLGKVIQDYFGDGSKYGVEISYIVETEPLGTAGALYYLKEKIDDDFFLLYGDLIFDIDFARFINFHESHAAIITLYVHPNAHPYDSDLIVADENSKVTEILSKKEKRNFYYHNVINAGLYCINPDIFKSIDKPIKYDLEKDLIAKQVKAGTVFAYSCTEYVKDMGTPDRLSVVLDDIRNRVVFDRNLKKKQKAIFLDRDGTINKYMGFLSKVGQFELLQGTAEAVAKINSSSYLAIVVTNQPVVARGECSFEELENIHKKMETDLGEQKAYLDDIFVCPNHPHNGYEGKISELEVDCECHKPKPGMFFKAAEKYNIDLSRSWYIGDTTTDIQAGINAGLKTILVQTGEAGKDGKYDVKPNYVSSNLLEAVNLILCPDDL